MDSTSRLGAEGRTLHPSDIKQPRFFVTPRADQTYDNPLMLERRRCCCKGKTRYTAMHNQAVPTLQPAGTSVALPLL